MTKQTLTGLLLAVCWIMPTAAFAAGTNFFVQGLSHPLMIPAQLIVTFSLGLLLGQQSWSHMRFALPAFIVTLAASLAMTRYQTAPWNSEMVLLPLAAVTGLLVILKLKLPVLITLIITIVAAVVIGMDSAVPVIPGLQARKIYANLAGSGVSVFGILLLVSLIAWMLRNILQGIALRVLGAWATAGAALVLALLLANVSVLK